MGSRSSKPGDAMRKPIARTRIRGLLVAVSLAALTWTGAAQERARATIPDQYKWNLADLYASDAAWRAAKEKLAAELPRLGAFKGRLGSSAAILADALEQMTTLDKELSRLDM